jgi:hypothetical protein
MNEKLPAKEIDYEDDETKFSMTRKIHIWKKGLNLENHSIIVIEKKYLKA